MGAALIALAAAPSALGDRGEARVVAGRVATSRAVSGIGGGDGDGVVAPHLVDRVATADDLAPLGLSSLPASNSARGIVVRDAVVSNTDPTLSGSDRVSDGEPVIAVNPTNPDQIVLQTGRDGYEAWQPGGCQPDPSYCPEGAGNANGSIWYSADRGAAWTKLYDIPLPPSVDAGACVCDRVLSWGADGRLVDVLLVFDHRIYMASTTNPTNPAAWTYPVDASGHAIPIASHNPLPLTAGPVGTDGYIDQPQTVVLPDPADPATQNVYVAYADDGSRGEDPRYTTWTAVAHGDNPPLFSRYHQIFGSPECCDGSTVPQVDPSTRTQATMLVHLAGDQRRGWIYAYWGLPQAVGFFGPQPAGQQFDTQMGTAALVEQHLVRSIDGGQTWQLNGNPNGIVVDRAFSQETSDKFATFNGLYGGNHSVGVDPVTGDVLYAYADLDAVTHVNRLAVRRLTNNPDGSMTEGPPIFLGDGHNVALPSVAVSDDGTVGVLYDSFDGMTADGYAVVSAHLARSNDGGSTYSDAVLERFVSVEKEDPNDTRQRPLGDYQQLEAVGDTFYGVFTGNGAPFGRPVADWDPIFVRAPSLPRPR